MSLQETQADQKETFSVLSLSTNAIIFFSSAALFHIKN